MPRSISMSSRRNAPSVTLVNGRLTRGSLDLLPFMPLDVLCEILCFLHPADLLVVARTTKAFRRFLLERSAAFVWKSARRNVDGLPEPPSDMNEVQYASLVFGFVCHYQGCDRKARDIVWHLRIRSCASCRPKYQPIKANESADFLAVCGMLACYPDTLQQYIPCGPFLNPKGNPVKGFQEHHIKTFVDELGALSPSERQAYLDHRRQTTEIICKFANAGVAWQLQVRNARIVKLRNKRAVRADIIREGLITVGFKEEIDYFEWDHIRKHPLINSTQAIGDKACSSVLDQLREYMLGWRELRMEEQVYAFRRRTFLDAWFQFTSTAFQNAAADSPHILPPSATIGFTEGIDSVIRQSGSISPESLHQKLRAVFPLAYEYIFEWHRAVRRELASLLPDYKADDDDEAVYARLRLTSSVFHCTGRICRGESRVLTYPEILYHPCFTLVTQGNGPSPKDPRGIANQKARLVMGGPWNCNGRVEAHPRRDVVDKVLLCCGKDPGSTTSAEMDKQDPRLVCAECAARDSAITFMSWRCTIQHHITFHPDSVAKQPSFMADQTMRVWIDIQGSRSLRTFPSASAITLGDYSVCLVCPPRIPSWNTRFGFEDLFGHIKNKHGVTSPVFGEHYTFDLNVTPVYLDILVPKKQRSCSMLQCRCLHCCFKDPTCKHS